MISLILLGIGALIFSTDYMINIIIMIIIVPTIILLLIKFKIILIVPEKYRKIIKFIDNIEQNNNSHIIFIVDDVSDNFLNKKYGTLLNRIYKVLGINENVPKKLTDKIMEFGNEKKFAYWISDKFESKKLLQIVIHTHGGDILSTDAIFKILLSYKGRIKVYIPYYAYSAGAMISLASDKIYMNKYSYISPLDPQLSYYNNIYSTNILMKLLDDKGTSLADEMYLTTQDAIIYHRDNLDNLIFILRKKKYKEEQIRVIIDELGSGKYPHHKQFMPSTLKKMGLKISTRMPNNINNLSNILLM